MDTKGKFPKLKALAVFFLLTNISLPPRGMESLWESEKNRLNYHDDGPLKNLLCVEKLENDKRIVTVSTVVFLPITQPSCKTAMPNIQGDLQNVINVLCNKMSIFVVIWSRMTFTVIGTAALNALDQSTD